MSVPFSSTANDASPPTVTAAPLVLVVDDDPGICDLVRMALELEGYAVVCVGDGFEAEAAVLVYRPDVVLLDVHIPGASGWQVAEWMQTAVPETPVVFMSVSDRMRAGARAHRAGGFLAKPFDLSRLVDAVERNLPPSAGNAHELRG